MIHDFFSLFGGEIFLKVVHGAVALSPLWVPTLFALVAFDLWLTYKRREFIKSQGSVLLEIKLPKIMTKSPLAMELFINTFYNPVLGTLLDAYIKG